MTFRRIGNAIRVNITFKPGFLQLLDAWAEITMQSRSEFVREAIRHYIFYLRKKGVKDEKSGS